MKKIFAVITAVAIFSFGMTTNVNAQEEAAPAAEAIEKAKGRESFVRFNAVL